MTTSETSPSGKSISGKWVILSILGFAICCTAFEWGYMKLYRAPFIPLREAIAKEFGRSSQVKIDGGRNKRGPMTLRVVIDVPFNPLGKTEADRQAANQAIQTLESLAVKHVDLSEYEFLQIYLVQVVPEGSPIRKEYERKIADVMAARKQAAPATLPRAP